MSKFDGLGGTPIKPQNMNNIPEQGIKSNKFEGLGGKSIQQNITDTSPQQEDEGHLANIGKSAITGVSRFLDVPQVIGTLAEKGSKLAAGRLANPEVNRNLNPRLRQSLQNYSDSPEVISPIKPASQRVRDFIGGEGNLDAKPVGAGQRIISEIVDVGTSLLTNPLGWVGTGGKLLSSGEKIKHAGSLLKSGTAIGATSGTLKEVGVDPLTADISATLATPLGGRVLNRAIGLSPNKINKQTYEAAKDLGIELPAAVVSRSKALDLVDSFVGKTPIFGDKLSKKYNLVGTRITEELEKVYDKIIPKTELAGIEDRIAKLYQKAETTIPKNGAIKPINLNNRISSVNKKIGKGYFTSDEEKEVLGIIGKIKNIMQEELTPKSLFVNKLNDIRNKVTPTNISILEDKSVSSILSKAQNKIEKKPAPIEKLVATKKSLNNQITWDKTEGYKEFLKGVQRAINEDIKAYSKTSVEAGNWYNYYTNADGLFGKVKTREALERILTGKTTDFATETIRHGNLSKIINDPKTRTEIKRLIGKTGAQAEKTLAKVDKIGEVAKAITIKNRNVPNPSGTANVGAIAAVMGGIVYDPITTISAVGGTALATSLVSNQKFLDSAYKALVLKDKSALIRFGKEIETITGASLVDLERHLDKSQDRPQLSSEERKQKNELRKEERKKAVEKSRKDMDKWIEEDRKNSLIGLFDLLSPSKQNKTK